MAQIILIFSALVLLTVGITSRNHGLGMWLFVLMAHGIFVYIFGNGLEHLPFYMGLVMLPIALFGREGFTINYLPIVLIFLFFTSISISFIVNGGDPYSDQIMIKYIKPMFVCILISGCIHSKRTLSVIAIYIIVAATIGSLFNIYQQILGVQLATNQWDESLNRAAGLRGDPNDTAMLLLLAPPLIYYKLVNSRTKPEKITYIVSSILVIAGLVLTGSRAGFAIMILLGVMLIMHKPNGSRPKLFSIPSVRNVILILVMSIVTLIAAPGYYWERMSTMVTGKEVGRAESLYHREYLLKKGIEIWSKNPIVGVGPGEFDNALYTQSNNLIRNHGSKNKVAHNMYIEFLAEFGFLGFSIFVSICVVSIRNFLHLDSRQTKNDQDQYIGYGYALGLFSMLVIGLTLSQGYNSVLWFILSIGLGTGRRLVNTINRKNSDTLRHI